MKRCSIAILIGLFLLVSCEEVAPVYPDEPVIDYLGFSIYVTLDELGNKTVMGRLSFDFTDGDGNLGLHPLPENTDPDLPDSLKYNFYLQLYDLKGYDFVEIPESEGGILRYRIPHLDKQPLKGTMDLDISYPLIIHDTVFYTFYVVDRSFNRSNTDTTDVIVLSGINLEEY
ncbi:MAG: hypothetical protein GY790_05800 [Bacteroidetes bacterium]|nr:hypothetical protein [Bacteroidota bacterium]